MAALYRKYRPQDFDEVVGQEGVVRTLTNAISNGQIRQAYLFAGPRGTGKTSSVCTAVEQMQPDSGTLGGEHNTSEPQDGRGWD